MQEVYGSRKGKNCVIYIRVSSERQVQGYSLEGQKRYLKDWCEFEGMTVSKIYVEPGKSGKSITGREEFQKMLSDIAERQVPIDFVVVFKLSRFGRNAKDILNSLTYIQRYGVNLICKEDGLDSSTSMGRMMITILGAVAEMERENILAQTMLGREEKAKQGGWNGGFAPYGYELVNGQLKIKEDEADIVKHIFDKFVNGGMGYSTIAGYLNRQGVPKLPAKNSHGCKFTDWNTHHIKRILDNPLYTGHIAFGRTRLERVEGTENDYRRVKVPEYIVSDEIAHEPIISDELFEKAQLKRKATTTAGNRKIGRSSKHLLSGILKCPMCGSSMYAEKVMWTNKDGIRREHLKYQCGHYAKSKFGQCKKNAIPAEWVEGEVIAYIKLLVGNPQFAEDIQKQIGQKVDVSAMDAEIENCRKKLKKLEKSKANLERDIDAIIDEDRNAERKRRDMNKRLDKIYEEIYDLEDQITECEQKKQAVEKNVLTRDNIYKILLVFDKFFDKMSKDDQRKMMESLVSEVHLHPKETWEESKNPIKEIKFAFPVGQEVQDSLRENVTSVEAEAETLEETIAGQEETLASLNAQLILAQKALETGTIEAESKRQSRQLALSSAQEIYDVTTELAAYDTENAKEDYEDAVEKLAELDSYIVDQVIYAQQDGVITAVSVSAGDTLQQDTELIALNSYDDVTITLTLDEDDMDAAALGSKAEVTFAAFPDEIFEGEVTEIGDAQIDSNTNTTTYQVVVSILENGSRLYEGMSAEVTFTRQEGETHEAE